MKNIFDSIEYTIFHIEDALWETDNNDKSELIESEKNDYQTAKELLESARNLYLNLLRDITTRKKKEE